VTCRARPITKPLVVRRANVGIQQAERLARRSLFAFGKREDARRESTPAKLGQSVHCPNGAGPFDHSVDADRHVITATSGHHAASERADIPGCIFVLWVRQPPAQVLFGIGTGWPNLVDVGKCLRALVWARSVQSQASVQIPFSAI
jgi:hypothetical protein